MCCFFFVGSDRNAAEACRELGRTVTVQRGRSDRGSVRVLALRRRRRRSRGGGGGEGGGHHSSSPWPAAELKLSAWGEGEEQSGELLSNTEDSRLATRFASAQFSSVQATIWAGRSLPYSKLSSNESLCYIGLNFSENHFGLLSLIL